MTTAAWIDDLAKARLRFEIESSDEHEIARRRRDAIRTFENALPPLYRWARLDSPLLAERVKLPIPRELPTARSVMLMGPPGIGKTSLAVAMLRAMLERELAPAKFASDDSAVQIARRYRFAHAHRLGAARISGPAAAAELEAAIRSRVLLLDDLGTDANIASNPVAEAIAERHAEERVTWVTTSLSPTEIAKRYGGGVARRLLEHSQLLRHTSMRADSIEPRP